MGRQEMCKGRDEFGKYRCGAIRQQVCKGWAIHGWDGCDRAVKVGKVATRNGEVRSGEAAKDRSGMIGYGVITHERSLYESNNG